MKILGIGVDIIENKRISNSIRNSKFKKRIFSNKELKQASLLKNKTNYFSKRFAAKESLAKSLGSGFRDNLNFKDIEILNDKNGKPFFSKSRKIDSIINKKFNVKKYDLFLSISDEKDYSIAFTTLQTK